MKHIRNIIVVVLLFISLSCLADYPLTLPACLKYIHVVEQGKVLPSDINELWELAGEDNPNGTAKRVWITKWSASYKKPTEQHCKDIETLAIAWQATKAKEQEADTEINNTKTLTAALVEVMNKKLPADKQITVAEIITAAMKTNIVTTAEVNE